jgi:hypothetical protein
MCDHTLEPEWFGATRTIVQNRTWQDYHLRFNLSMRLRWRCLMFAIKIQRSLQTQKLPFRSRPTSGP